LWRTPIHSAASASLACCPQPCALRDETWVRPMMTTANIEVTQQSVTQQGEIDDRRQTPDRRSSTRRKTLKSGRTYWLNGDSSECRVLNVSETGAHLELCGPAPNVFDLVIAGDRARRSCFVIWRKARRVGVKFKEPWHVASSADRSTKPDVLLTQFIGQCQNLAKKVKPSHREMLLEMAEGWKMVIRRLQEEKR